MREKLIRLLKERSPQTTYELARKVHFSWHTTQEALLELLAEGKVKRMKVGGRHLWFYDMRNDEVEDS